MRDHTRAPGEDGLDPGARLERRAEPRRGGMAQTARDCSSEGVSVSCGWVAPQTT